MLKGRNLNGYTFADINCRLCAKLDDGFYYFEDETEFKDLIKHKLGEEQEGSISEEDSDTVTGMDDEVLFNQFLTFYFSLCSHSTGFIFFVLFLICI